MPRWLVVSVLALLLSCFGVGTFAQALAGVDQHDGGSQLQVSSAAPLHDDGHSNNNADDASTTPGEAASDHGEATSGRHAAFIPALFSASAPQLPVTGLPSPAPDRPRRPPRDSAFAA